MSNGHDHDDHEDSHGHGGHDDGHFDDHEDSHGHGGGHGEHGHGDGRGNHDDHGGYGDGRGGGHGGHDDHEETSDEPLIEPAGIINDLAYADPENQTVDLSEFFPISKVVAVRHNDSAHFDDLKKGEGAKIDLSVRRSLRVAKLRSKRFSDVLSKKECAPNLLSYVDKSRVVRAEPLILAVPVRTPEYGVDVRTLEVQNVVAPLRGDLFLPVSPLSRKAFRFLKKRRNKVAKIVVVGAALGLVSFVAIVTTVGYATNGIQRSYVSLFELKAKAEGGSRAFAEETGRIRKEFRKISFVFAPVEAVFDSPVLSVSSVRMAGSVVRWGTHLSEAADTAAKIWADFDAKSGNAGNPLLAFSSGSSFKATDFVVSHQADLRKIDSELSLALGEYAKVNELPDPALNARFKAGITALMDAQSRLRFALDRMDPALEMFGHSEPKRYLVFNQNKDELRATGGFPGSAIFVEFYKGRVQKYEKKDIYYYDWHLFPFAEKAPAGLARVSEKWGLRDANYYPELDRNFEKIDEFYQKSGGSSLDGVIFLNQSLVTDLLEITGPVMLTKIGKSMDANNFSTFMSVLVENKVGKTYSPKDVLFDFATAFETALLEKKEYSEYIKIADRNAKSGEMLAYAKDEESNALLREFFPGERVRELAGNFVYPVFTSVSGNKSDRYVFRTFELSAESVSGCRVLNHFRLESDHRMSIDDKERVRGMLFDLGIAPEEHEKQIFIQGNGQNRQYVRVLVPKGSKLFGQPPITVSIDESQPGYDVFAFDHDTEVGSKSAAFFDYETETPDCGKEPRFFRQSGLTNYLVK